ncbi:uncharacterized protein LOC106157722 [Lingula anatina]|uniref:Uncharacterized protein LOC106157722 n=1 Tax=Lingula anatina TaxID=7574 RepID=A0A1S3HSA4_LINAN|nr:uncharacterized protein LOC106157722 [Lingula anatina]|eukprot:XP_013388913.1 uncharacterized protein LOC106157722 [Lingula anatina]
MFNVRRAFRVSDLVLFIIKKAERALLRERINITNQRIIELKKDKNVQAEKVKERLKDDKNIYDITFYMVDKVGEKEFQRSKKTQINKLNKLTNKHIEKSNTVTEVDLTGTQLKQWVKVLSNYQPTEDEMKLIAKGLNYAIAPSKLPVRDVIIQTEVACQKLNIEQAAKLRHEVVGTLRSSNPPKPNLTKGERNAIKPLKNNKDIIIIPADKGKAVVTMDRNEYEEKCNNLLKDETTYKQLAKDPTQKLKARLINKLKNIRKENRIDDATYQKIYPTAEVTPRFYATPKIHKKDNPVRPIVSGINSITYELAKHLAKLLKPLVGKTNTIYRTHNTSLSC